MNRRQFTQSLAALAAVPALPTRVIASAAPHVSTTRNPQMWGSMVASARGHLSHDMLVKELGFSGDVANQVINKLVRTNVVGSANANGVCQTTKPILSHLNSVPNTTHIDIKTDKIKDHLDKILDEPDDIHTDQEEFTI